MNGVPHRLLSLRFCAGVWSFLVIMAVCCTTIADVVVLQNSTPYRMRLSVQSGSGIIDTVLSGGQSSPFFVSGDIQLKLGNTRAAVGKSHDGFRLQPYAAYRLSLADGKIRADRIPLGGTELTLKSNPKIKVAEAVEIAVSLWIDEAFSGSADPELFLRRFKKAAKVIEEHSGVKFKVARVGSWKSSARISNFTGSLFEFIDSVDPGESLAIGFTPRYPSFELNTDRKIAGTRRPLDQHILVREWRGPETDSVEEQPRGVSENELVELLVHELGHYLGGAHSRSNRSAMRPRLADGRARAANHLIQVDPINTLLMSVIGEELRTKPASELGALSSQTRMRLRQIYSKLALDFPADPTPARFLELLR